MMGERTAPEYRVLLTTDIEDYSTRTDAEQQVLQEALATKVNDAADLAKLNRADWLVQVAGDSVFAILPNGTNLARLMDVFVRELDAGLGSYNRRRVDDAWTRMRLRLAVHAGLVHLNGPTGWPGQHAVLPVRLRDCEPVRAVLGALRSADLAVIVSADVYRDYITQGPGNPRPTEFRTVVAEGKGKSLAQDEEKVHAHLLVPGFDVHAIAALAKFDVSSAEFAGLTPPGIGAGNESTQACPEAGSRPVRPEAPPISAEGNVTMRDSYEVSGGGHMYNAGGDINLTPDRPAGSSDGR
jgi:hypothetical protein